MFPIDDSAFPPPVSAPTFADTAVGATYRNESNQYQRKLNGSQSYDFSSNAIVAPSSDEHCAPVSAELVITAP